MAFPLVLTHQDKLLTVDTNKAKWVKNAFGVEGLDMCPLFLDAANGVWVLRARYAPGMILPKHFHTGSVHFITLAGRWNYTEYPNQPQTEGCYLYEPGGSIHQFSVPADATEPAEGFMVVTGANINFDDEGNYLNLADAGVIEAILNQNAAEQGLGPLNYIRPGMAAETVS